MATLTVNSKEAVQVDPRNEVNQRSTVTFLTQNRSASTVYYKSDSGVSSTNNDGSLAAGQSLTLDRVPKWFIAGPAADGSQGAGTLTAVAPVEEQHVGVLLRYSAGVLQVSTDHGASWQDAGHQTVYNAKDFGVVGDGSTDDSAAGQAGFTAAAGKPLIFPAATYRMNSSLSIPAGGLHLVLDDAILDFSSLAASGTAITGTGSLGTPVSCNGVAFGATAITGAAGIEAGLSPGDTLKIWSSDVFDPGQTNSTNGEQLVVLSTSSGQINVLGSVMGVYSTSVQFAKVTPIPITIEGSGQILMGGSGSGHKALIAHFANRLRILGPKLEVVKAEVTGIQLFDSINWEVGYIDVRDSTDSGTGYGFSATNTCQNGRVHNSHFRNCRHWTSVNTSATDHGGIARHLTFEQCYGQYTPAGCDGFDSHAAAEYLTYDGCEGRDCGNVTFNIEAPSATVKHCKSFTSASNGILVLAAAAKAPEYRITDNEVWDATGKGIQYAAQTGLGSPSPTTLDIMDNVLVRCAAAACYADPLAEHRLLGARMTGNRAYNCGTSGNQVFYMNKADVSEMRNTSINTPNAKIGSRADDFTGGEFGGVTHFVSAGTARGFYGTGMIDSLIKVAAVNASGAGCKGLELDATSDRCTIYVAALKDATTPVQLNGIGTHKVLAAAPAQAPTLSSAATLALPSQGDVFKVSGAATITDITGGWRERTVKLIFTSTAQITRNGTTLVLQGNFTGSASAWIMLTWDGASWFELGRGYDSPAGTAGITVTASPFTWQNTIGPNVKAIVQGGTVSKIEYSRDNSNFFDIGVTAGLIPVGSGEYIRVTYSVAPTMRYIADLF